ncbi:uncharacterized protein LY89DRAFT_620807 [Mollisia scopiformis]|uniref:Uncharacterized protein n=1 Tax=Mollisia scopiformis TaxID=149040 RepID=A0A194X2F4_MOLSC|nr:uncharacterized protein LY89DRAFT_620807 [Mollisia scopiformis]KUJ14380.1 hypothetical protein LY89DRAFT_620807 [Mollisia scopiformis]
MAESEPDLTFLNELYGEIERNPPALEARKLLTQHCYHSGWTDAARENLQQLRALDPSALEEEPWTRDLLQKSSSKATDKSASESGPSPVQVAAQKLEMVEGYQSLRLRAKKMLQETRLLQNFVSSPAGSTNPELRARFEAHDPDLNALVNGRVSSVLKVQQPGSARGIARQMEKDPEKAVDVAASDLEDVARWLRSHVTRTTAGDNDAIREALVKRAQALSAALPDALKKHPSTAMMHIEHEVLKRKYHSEETMYGDLVSDIPRAQFLVTDDGYGWDMEELAQAIKSNGGIMRNPLSKQMFSPDDVRAIIQHPLGQDLAALQIEQSKLSLGIREKTVDELDKMAKVFLADMSEDQLKSREVLETFIAYLATLPVTEQEALDKLRVPAVDSHTGMAFDTSIGEAVRDAQGNKLCFHKCADLLTQAVSHLKKSR